MKKKKEKGPFFELWDIQDNNGLQFNTQLHAFEWAMEISGNQTKERYFLLLQNNILFKTITVQSGKISWVNHL